MTVQGYQLMDLNYGISYWQNLMESMGFILHVFWNNLTEWCSPCPPASQKSRGSLTLSPENGRLSLTCSHTFVALTWDPLEWWFHGGKSWLDEGELSCEHSIWEQRQGPNSKSCLFSNIWRTMSQLCLDSSSKECSQPMWIPSPFFTLPLHSLSVVISFTCVCQSYLDQSPHTKRQCWWMTCQVLPLT